MRQLLIALLLLVILVLSGCSVVNVCVDDNICARSESRTCSDCREIVTPYGTTPYGSDRTVVPRPTSS